MMPGAILGWLFIIFGVVFPIGDETVRTFWLAITCMWVIVHPLELILSIPIGKKAGIPTGTTVLNTLLFGFTWWLPVKMGVLNK
jgi:uncharacterized protein YhhL (DUF1145 family)